MFTHEGNGIPESTAILYIQRRDSGPGVQPNERARIPRVKRQPHNGDLTGVHRGRPAHTQRLVQLPKAHRRTVRPTERSPPPRAQILDAKNEDLETMLYGCVVTGARARANTPAAPVHHSFLARSIGSPNAFYFS